MALEKTKLKNEIQNLLQDMIKREHTSMDEFANRLTESIHNYIQNAEIQYNNGLIAPNGAVTGVFNGNLK